MVVCVQVVLVCHGSTEGQNEVVWGQYCVLSGTAYGTTAWTAWLERCTSLDTCMAAYCCVCALGALSTVP